MTASTATTRSAAIHSAAHVDPSAIIGAAAVIEMNAFIGPGCIVGPECRIRPYAMLVQDVEMGRGNDVHPYAVLGGDPQIANPAAAGPGCVIIGERNTFREGVTINRSSTAGGATRIGDNNYLMAASHLGHDVRIGDNNVLANGFAAAGHVTIADRCFFGASAGIHQYCMIGEGVMMQGTGAASQHVPPFVILVNYNRIAGINMVGLRRNPAATDRDRREVRTVYGAIYRTRRGRPIAEVLAELRQQEWGPFAQRFLDFIDKALFGESTHRRCGIAGGQN